MKIPLDKPEPDVEHFKKVILRKEKPRRVHFIELHADGEIIQCVTEDVLKRKWVELSDSADEDERVAYLKNYIEFYYRLGYGSLRLTADARFSTGLSFDSKGRTGEDTASLSRGERGWTESKGIISSWENFEKYQWPSPEEIDLWAFEFLSKNLPEGMGFWACFSGGVFEIAMNQLLGLEALSYLLYDDMELVKAVFNKAGELILESYKRVIGLDKLCRLGEEELRRYVRGILDECMPGGGYVLGSGNSVANYVPVENFLIMLDEGMRWGE